MPRHDDFRSVGFSVVRTFLNASTIALVVLCTIGIVYRAIKPRELQGSELAIALAQHAARSTVDDAAGMVLKVLRMSDSDRVDAFVQDKVAAAHGVVAMKGWSSKPEGPDLYMVSFEWTVDNKDWGIHYEVDTRNRFVRPIVPDDVLAMKYGVRQKADYDAAERESADLLKKAFPQVAGQIKYADHVMTVSGNPTGDFDPDEVAREFYNTAKPAMSHRKDSYLHVVITKGAVSAEYDGKEL